MPYNTMSHVGLEDDYATKEQLTAMSTSWHYGWRWRGPEKCDSCDIQPCGLITFPDPDCEVHKHKRLAAAKQLHHVQDCAGKR